MAIYVRETNGVESIPGQRQVDENDRAWGIEGGGNVYESVPECASILWDDEAQILLAEDYA